MTQHASAKQQAATDHSSETERFTCPLILFDSSACLALLARHRAWEDNPKAIEIALFSTSSYKHRGHSACNGGAPMPWWVITRLAVGTIHRAWGGLWRLLVPRSHFGCACDLLCLDLRDPQILVVRGTHRGGNLGPTGPKETPGYHQKPANNFRL